MATNPTFSGDTTPNWPKREGAMSEEEFHELERLNPDRKYEYINGVAYKRRGCSVGHDRITRNIAALLDKYLTRPCTSFGVDVQVLVSTQDGKRHYVYPDATVSCHIEDRRLDNTLIVFPGVVFEIIAPDTEARDRSIKLEVYKDCSTTQEIVLVNQFAPRVEVWQRAEQNAMLWHLHRYSPTESPGEPVVLASVHVQVGLEEWYQGMNFVLDLDDIDDDDE